jgi:flagellar basal-body rod modification protein FlgD
MTIPSATAAMSAPATADGSSRVPQKQLGQNDFLRLLTVQLTQQDPMAPMTDQSFIAQMAQFSSLQQATQMAAEMGRMRSDSQMQAASGLIGREVTVAMADGDITGVVDEVATDGGEMHVRIDETYYPFSLVYRVSAVAPQPVTS